MTIRLDCWVSSVRVMLACTCLAHTFQAQAATPQAPKAIRDITIVVPYQAGGDADTSARTLLPVMQKYLKDSRFKIENQPGNSGIVATQKLQTAPADGDTVMLARVGNLIVAPAMDSTVHYSWADFTVLALLEFDPLVCVVPASSGVNSARNLMKEIREHPGKLHYAAAGRGSAQNFAVLHWLKLSGLNATDANLIDLPSSLHVLHALLEGRADFACSSFHTLSADMRSGKLLGLFTTSPTQLTGFPRLPTAQEAGLRDLSKIVGWSALIAPAKIPPDVLRRWRVALKQTANDPAWISAMEQLGRVRPPRTLLEPEDFAKQQAEFYEDMVVSLGLRR